MTKPPMLLFRRDRSGSGLVEFGDAIEVFAAFARINSGWSTTPFPPTLSAAVPGPERKGR